LRSGLGPRRSEFGSETGRCRLVSIAAIGWLLVLLSALPARAQVADDAISREFTVFNDTEPPPVYGDAISREFTVYVGNQPLRPQVDAVTREFTVFNDPVAGTPANDAISREFTVYVGNQPLRPQIDSLSREFTAFNEEAVPAPGDAISREFTVYFGGQPIREQVDCITREFTVNVFGPGPGDLNCDGVVTMADIGPFVLALLDPAGYLATFPSCDIFFADLNQDGAIDGDDTQGFVQRVFVGP
jgi:hypothetical protein